MRASPELRSVAAEGRALGLPLAVAVSLVCEHQLLATELGSTVTDDLDQAAAHTGVAAALASTDAAYLRLLTIGRKDQAVPVPADGWIVVDLPARLSSRILRHGSPDELVRRDVLTRAHAWERAAVTEGRTMSEWAPLAALRARGA